MTEDSGVAQILADTKVLLLDFDGPICNVFSEVPAPLVAQRLSAMIARAFDDASLSDPKSDDPLDVLRNAVRYGDSDLLVLLENELQRSELEAVKGAAATPFAAEAIKAAREAGRDIAVVSNNSRDAIRTFLDQRGLATYVSTVVGRPEASPELMKPHPRSIQLALEALHVGPRSAVLVGDSVSDVEAARSADTWSIGFANREGKGAKLLTAGADAIIEGKDGMARISAAYASLAA